MVGTGETVVGTGETVVGTGETVVGAGPTSSIAQASQGRGPKTAFGPREPSS